VKDLVDLQMGVAPLLTSFVENTFRAPEQVAEREEANSRKLLL
jgi:hypothetical protein